MCKLLLRRNTAQDSKIQPCTFNLIKNRYFMTKALHNTQRSCRICSGEGPHYLQWVLCVLHKITGSTQFVTCETAHTEAVWLLLEASLLFPLQQAWNCYRRLRKKGKKGNPVRYGCCTWPDQWGETTVCWVIRSSCMKALFKLKRSVREKKQKNKQQQHTMDADKQGLNKALGGFKTTGKLISHKHPISCLK